MAGIKPARRQGILHEGLDSLINRVYVTRMQINGGKMDPVLVEAEKHVEGDGLPVIVLSDDGKATYIGRATSYFGVDKLAVENGITVGEKNKSRDRASSREFFVVKEI